MNINARESRELIDRVQAEKTAAVVGRFTQMAQLSVSAEATANNQKLASADLDRVRGTNLPGALAVALMMSKCASKEEGPVIAGNAQKLALSLEDVKSMGARGYDRVSDAAKDILRGEMPGYTPVDRARDLLARGGERASEVGEGVLEKLRGAGAAVKGKAEGLAQGGEELLERAGLNPYTMQEAVERHVPGGVAGAAGIGAGVLGAGGLAAYLASRKKKRD